MAANENLAPPARRQGAAPAALFAWPWIEIASGTLSIRPPFTSSNGQREIGSAMLFGKRERTIVRILIVEDEPLVAFDNEHFLRDAGFEIVGTVDRVEDAVALIEAEPLDLVLADVSLSDGGDGLDVARCAHSKGVPVLFVTGACPVWLGWFAGSAACVMREITQREYQWIEAFGGGRRRNMAWYEGMKFWEWNRHSIEETVIALAAAALVAIVVARNDPRRPV
jgi:hypothetical protein